MDTSSESESESEVLYVMLKLHSHMHGVDAGRGGWKIGFNTNPCMWYDMCSDGDGVGTNLLCMEWVQYPIFCIRLKLCTPNLLLPSMILQILMPAYHVCVNIREITGAGMSKSARLRSATNPDMCERRLTHLPHVQHICVG